MEEKKLKARAVNNAYALLRQRPRSEFEIRDRLKAKGYGPEIVESVIESLKRSGEIDDRRFARLWVESKMQFNPAGDVVLRYELKNKGVSSAVIDEALCAKEKDYDEYAIVLRIAAGRFEQLKKIDRKKALKRVYDYLLRRGFKYDTVRNVVDKIVADV